jgi:hypothetical protein
MLSSMRRSTRQGALQIQCHGCQQFASHFERLCAVELENCQLQRLLADAHLYILTQSSVDLLYHLDLH